MSTPLVVEFQAGSSGTWRIERIAAVVGESLPDAGYLNMHEGNQTRAVVDTPAWALKGITSNTRYTTREEVTRLSARQQGLGRPEAMCAALIPIRKTAAWWALAQDERRAIIEEQSRHIQIGLEYLPAIARRLHHSRDLGEPFDFVTWFEFPVSHKAAFETLVQRLRDTEEWRYVEREVDVRLYRE
ncbi:MAG TPA: chlorite dismutase family protein [Rhodocyclaceae bacterium]|nr:chlorite dismutase family protein [Rhodocyclaceae bacterium]